MNFEIRQAALSAGTLNYHEAGEGAPVLYLHSAGGVSITAPLEALSKDHRVLAPVAPGFDGTERLPGVENVRDYAELVAEFAERQGGKLDVIGSSFGGWVALWLAVLRPDLVDRLILQVPAGFRFEGKGGLPPDPEARLKALYAHPDRAPAPKPAEIAEGNLAAYEALRQGVALDEALNARLAEVEAVTLILLGTEDPVVPSEAGVHLERHIAAAQRVFVSDAAHAVESDQPEQVTRLWREFLTRGQGFVPDRPPDVA